MSDFRAIFQKNEDNYVRSARFRTFKGSRRVFIGRFVLQILFLFIRWIVKKRGFENELPLFHAPPALISAI